MRVVWHMHLVGSNKSRFSIRTNMLTFYPLLLFSTLPCIWLLTCQDGRFMTLFRWKKMSNAMRMVRMLKDSGERWEFCREYSWKKFLEWTSKSFEGSGWFYGGCGQNETGCFSLSWLSLLLINWSWKHARVGSVSKILESPGHCMFKYSDNYMKTIRHHATMHWWHEPPPRQCPSDPSLGVNSLWIEVQMHNPYHQNWVN